MVTLSNRRADDGSSIRREIESDENEILPIAQKLFFSSLFFTSHLLKYCSRGFQYKSKRDHNGIFSDSTQVDSIIEQHIHDPLQETIEKNPPAFTGKANERGESSPNLSSFAPFKTKLYGHSEIFKSLILTIIQIILLNNPFVSYAI